MDNPILLITHVEVVNSNCRDYLELVEQTQLAIKQNHSGTLLQAFSVVNEDLNHFAWTDIVRNENDLINYL